MPEDLPLWGNVAVFLAASVAVWLAGTRVTRYADALQAQTQMGEALIGMLLLGFISALPELAVTVSASWAGNAGLAVNNLLGGMALNVAILASADAAIRREVLTAAIATPAPLLQAALLIVLLSIVAAATVVGDVPLYGVGAWSVLIVVLYVLCLRVIHQTRNRGAWVPREHAGGGRVARDSAPVRDDAGDGSSRARLVVKIVAGAAVILAAGYALSESGDALAEQTGLGESFFGAVFLALSTSLPEISIVYTAVRMGRYEMAIGDILGANLFGLALIFVADLAYTSGPVLAEVGAFSTFAALLGIAVTGLFVAGLLERSHFRIMRMGVDSLAVLGTYAAGLVVLYGLR